MSKLALHLYINGESHISVEAIDILNTICQDKVPGDYQPEVIDIQLVVAGPKRPASWPFPP